MDLLYVGVLGYRQCRWPNTANPHLFIHYRNAPTASPSTTGWVRRRLGISAQSIRQDRLLDEAHASCGGYVRIHFELFGLSGAGADRYAVHVGDHAAISEFEAPSPS